MGDIMSDKIEQLRQNTEERKEGKKVEKVEKRDWSNKPGFTLPEEMALSIGIDMGTSQINQEDLMKRKIEDRARRREKQEKEWKKKRELTG